MPMHMNIKNTNITTIFNSYLYYCRKKVSLYDLKVLEYIHNERITRKPEKV